MYSSLPTEIFSIVDSPYQAVVGADVLFLVTEWEQFRNLDVSQLIEKMQNPVIIDGRNLWSNIDFSQTEAKYIGIGRHSLTTNKASANVQLLAG
jgi:UDPglucose 6-dehydrogenase